MTMRSFGFGSLTYILFTQAQIGSTTHYQYNHGRIIIEQWPSSVSYLYGAILVEALGAVLQNRAEAVPREPLEAVFTPQLLHDLGLGFRVEQVIVRAEGGERDGHHQGHVARLRANRESRSVNWASRYVGDGGQSAAHQDR